MATNDSGITDTCLYMEAFSGDGGVHTDPNTQYWLSPDVIMTTTGDSGQAIVGANTTKVRIHCKGSGDGGKCPSTDQEGGATTVVFELYVGPPSLWLGNPSNVGPYLPNYVAQIPIVSPAQPVEAGGSGTITAGGFVDTTVNWTATNNASDPQGVGHKCLVARCYPYETSTPDNGVNGLTGHLPNDPHYVQHNLSIVASEGGGKKMIPIRTANPFPEPQLASFQATFDTKPNRRVLDAILPSLGSNHAFKRISPEPPKSAQFDLSSFDGAHEGLLQRIEGAALRVLEELEERCRKSGGVTARKVLPPHRAANLHFVLDTSGATPGDAFVCHVTQTDIHGHPGGGITVVSLVV